MLIMEIKMVQIFSEDSLGIFHQLNNGYLWATELHSSVYVQKTTPQKLVYKYLKQHYLSQKMEIIQVSISGQTVITIQWNIIHTI